MCFLGLDLLLRPGEGFKCTKQLITSKKIVRSVAVEGIKSTTLEYMWWRACNSVLIRCKEDCLVGTATEGYIP